MQICMKHWAMLQDAIKEMGMDYLVAKDSEEAKKKLEDAMDNGVTVTNFDPLLAVNSMIAREVAEMFGPEILDSEGCPVCEVIVGYERYKDEFEDANEYNSKKSVEEHWIKGPVASLFEYTKEMKLILTA